MASIASVVGMAGGLAAVLVLAGCRKDDAAAALPAYTGPLLEVENPVTLLSDSARLHVRLTGPLEQRFENGDVLYPKGALVTFYDKPGKLVVNTLQGNWVKFESNKQLYTMRGKVRVVNVPKEQRLHTEELFFDRAKQVIYTDKKMFVQVITPTDSLAGYGMRANQDFSRYQILRPVGKMEGGLGATE